MAATQQSNKLVVGGVPEHFNAPWQLAVSSGLFRSLGVDLEFREIPEGTGKMCAGLRDGSLDVAVVLTEGIVKDIVDGNQSKIFATYVESPLTWAILAAAKTDLKTVDDLRGKTMGISRFGSGSHLMSYVLADEKDWLTESGCELNFSIKNNFANLREGVNDKSTDAFLWERFMTKPYVDKGELTLIGTIVTPWPCFMIAVRTEVLEHKFDLVKKMLIGIQQSTRRFKSDKQGSVDLISKKFGLKREDAEKWFDEVRFSEEGKISRRVLVSTIDTLIRAKILPGYKDAQGKRFNFGTLYDPRAKVADVDSAEIRTMKLFYAKRLLNQLKVIGKDLQTENNLSVPELKDFDHLHYHGTEAVEQAAQLLKLNETKTVMEVGSGLGGPARYMAWKYGCTVFGVEIEEDRHRLASLLTSRSNLNGKVIHWLADATHPHLPENFLDHFVSWLSILHIHDRDGLFSSCYRSLKPGGSFVIEDFYEREPLTEQEKADLDIVVTCPYTPSQKGYEADLLRNGFVDLTFEDLTKDWADFVTSRLQGFESTRKQQVEIHGEKVVEGVIYFFTVIQNLFSSGHLGGIRITGRKPQ